MTNRRNHGELFKALWDARDNLLFLSWSQLSASQFNAVFMNQLTSLSLGQKLLTISFIRAGSQQAGYSICWFVFSTADLGKCTVCLSQNEFFENSTNIQLGIYKEMNLCTDTEIQDSR